MGKAVIIPKFGTVTFGSPNVNLEVNLCFQTFNQERELQILNRET